MNTEIELQQRGVNLCVRTLTGISFQISSHQYLINLWFRYLYIVLCTCLAIHCSFFTHPLYCVCKLAL